MSDPHRPGGYDPNRPPDPAYGGYYSYPSYVPPGAPGPTQPLPTYWTQTQYQSPPPPMPPQQPPPDRPKSPRWLWLVAGGAVTLVIALVIALIVANGSDREDTAVSPLPSMPESSSKAPLPTTTRRSVPRPTRTMPPPMPSPTAPTAAPPPSTDEAATESVVYTVSGQGRAISITYVDAGGMLQMEFNVALPWSREVSLSATTAQAASVTVINVGREISCSITLNGTVTQEHSGTGLTICSSMGG